MLKVCFFICNQMLATSVSLPLEQLYSAQSILRGSKRGKAQRLLDHELEIAIVSIDGAMVTTHTGIPITPNATLEESVDSDIVYLPALWRNPMPVLRNNHALLPWLRRCNENGAILAGVSTGCFFLAEAGLLDEKAATTHWYYFDLFQKHFPQVHLKRQHFITQAGNVYCTGSVNSLAELTIYFIERYYSKHIASHVERHFFHEIRHGYDRDYTFTEESRHHPDEEIIQIQIWMQDNFHLSFTLADLAQRFQMSSRSFSRRFKNATGKTPLSYLQTIRMGVAKDLLKTSNLNINEIMFKVGYHDSAHFNKLFKAHNNTTPKEYRKTVRAKIFSV